MKIFLTIPQKNPQVVQESNCVFCQIVKKKATYEALAFGPNQLIFPPKQQVPCRFSLNLPLFGLGSLSKGLGTNLKAFDQ
jgi:hypothetical protein